MSHDYESADWADHHKNVSTGLARLFEMLSQVFERLAAIEYDAPWERICRQPIECKA
ncbi:hypothetical protein MZO42_02225 [Sphingomonas psychrotolerans]|uniref:Uncharacterized protein n=1 Tax=Sphingomonas psychrotolerans TaxID=1327635 RepID=A0ABU3MZ41_9SPHN|nr:hypothetical protein [Sphingomonas psychrotolerans]MDT8757503.1 hypothetical protein [Sphingomonas psychrotolerans]